MLLVAGRIDWLLFIASLLPSALWIAYFGIPLLATIRFREVDRPLARLAILDRAEKRLPLLNFFATVAPFPTLLYSGAFVFGVAECAEWERVMRAIGMIGSILVTYWSSTWGAKPPSSPMLAVRIIRPAGWTLRAVAEFVYSRKTFERVFEPIIADLQFEHVEALAAKRIWKARWIRVRGALSFVEAAVLQLGVDALKHASKLWSITK